MQKSLQSDIILVENEIITSDKKDVAEKLNIFFTKAGENLGIETYVLGTTDEVQPEILLEIMDQYNKHPSIKKIKEYVNEEHNFSFGDSTSQDLEKQILELDTKKENIDDDIPTRILIETNNVVSYHLTKFYN